jgi:hypothetical protein
MRRLTRGWHRIHRVCREQNPVHILPFLFFCPVLGRSLPKLGHLGFGEVSWAFGISLFIFGAGIHGILVGKKPLDVLEPLETPTAAEPGAVSPVEMLSGLCVSGNPLASLITGDQDLDYNM